MSRLPPQLSQRGNACYFHSPVREKWRCQSPELSDSSQSQALNSTNPPIRKIRAPLMPRTSLSQSRHSFWSQSPLVLIDTISPPSPQQIALVKGLWALCLWGCAGIIPRSSVLLAGLQDGCVSPSRCTVTYSQGGIEGERAAVRNDQSQGAQLLVMVP